MSGPMFSCNLHIKYRLLFSYLRKHAKYSVFITIVNMQNEKPNYKRKKKILVLGKMNLMLIQVGSEGVISSSHNQPKTLCLKLTVTVSHENRYGHCMGNTL